MTVPLLTEFEKTQLSERQPLPERYLGLSDVELDRRITAAKAALGALTETATIDAALDLVVFRTDVFSALDRAAAEGGFAPASRSRHTG